MVLALLTLTALQAQPVREWRKANEAKIIREYTDLLAIPNIARDTPNIQRNAAFITRMFAARGVPMRLLEVPNSPPAIFGEIKTPGATRTIIFYAHYDGQPVEPKEWISGDPFLPTMMDAAGKKVEYTNKFDPEWRLYARSAGDDKAPLIALAAVLDSGVKPRANIKFFFDGEEEAGSPHLEQIVRKYKDLLQGDVWLFCDGPVHPTRRQQILFGARGVTEFQLIVYGAKRELHSGHYGNWAPNPAMMLAQLLATMKDAEGHVLVKDFEKGIAPYSPTELRALKEAPDYEADLRKELQLARVDGDGERLDMLLGKPSLNIRGLQSAGVGAQSRNVIPATATASIDIRLVKGIDQKVAIDRVIDHIRRQGYFVTEQEPDADMRQTHPKIARIIRGHGYNAVRTSMDLEISKQVIRAVEAARGPVVKLPTMGGSLPLPVFDEVLKTPVIVVPIANHDNNQHGHNENMRLQNLWDGIETMAALLSMQ